MPKEPEGRAEEHSRVLSSCAVTCSGSKAKSGQFEQGQPSQAEGHSESPNECDFSPIPPLSGEECTEEQTADPTLKPLLELVYPNSDPKSVSSSCY